MAREEKIVEISEGRDAGKKFRIVEMPAMKAERLAWRAIQGAAKGGAAISPEMGFAAFQVIRQMDMSAFMLMPTEDMDYVLSELMACVTVVNAGPDRDGNMSDDLQTPRKPLNSDFEEVDTIFRLRKEALELHMGFLTRYAPSTSA